VFWPQQDPIGKSIRLPGSADGTAEVVGVVKDAEYRTLRGDTDPIFYRSILQTRSTDAMTLHVRASTDPGELLQIRQTGNGVGVRISSCPLESLNSLPAAEAAIQTRFGGMQQKLRAGLRWHVRCRPTMGSPAQEGVSKGVFS
jgi:hypothetical protein